MPSMSTNASPKSASEAGAKAPENGRLAGKRSLITGAASGIGRAAARLFAREGARVLLVDREASGLAEAQKEIESAGGCAIVMVGDAGSQEDVRSWVERCRAEWDGLDVVFGNAGLSGGYVPLDEQTPELWQEILRVNLLGPFLLVKHAVRLIREGGGGGSIIVTSSVAGLRARAGSLPYSASKAGLISLVQTSANELTGSGVRINAVCPGLIETGMTAPLFAYARARGTQDRLGSMTPAQRAGHPDEVAQLVLFLASDESSYVNGQAIPVDGGLSSTHPFRPMQQNRAAQDAAPSAADG